MGYMRSPLISLCLHLRQTLGEDGGTKEIAAGIKGEVKERQRGRDRKNTAEQTLDRPRCDSLINDTVDGCTDGDAQWRDRHFWRLSNKKKKLSTEPETNTLLQIKHISSLEFETK